jgi:hypothetical protein
MGEWRNYHIYYTDLDRLILECVYPLLERHQEHLEKCFWERHYAGGPHVRVRLHGSADDVSKAASELVAEATSYMTRFPSAPQTNYSSQLAKKMVEMEDEPSEPEDLAYRVNEIHERPYQRLNHRLVSDEAARLLEDFLQDIMPIVAAILKAPLPKLEQMLRIYFVDALFGSKDLPHGCVSFKSHWEGLAMNYSNPRLNDRIESNYAQKRERIRELMLDVKEHFENKTLENDPILKGWVDIVTRYSERTRTVLETGQHITPQYETIENVRLAKQNLEEHMWQDSNFLRTLYGDERFLALVQYEPKFLVPRVMVNLLYRLLGMIGLNVIDKMALCYYAHRIVEDHFQCDLTDFLKENMEKIVNRHAHRLTQQ